MHDTRGPVARSPVRMTGLVVIFVSSGKVGHLMEIIQRKSRHGGGPRMSCNVRPLCQLVGHQNVSMIVTLVMRIS